ncbi:MAG: hypothetical protein AAGG99_07440, partial [Pseudomonadota bacterium]
MRRPATTCVAGIGALLLAATGVAADEREAVPRGTATAQQGIAIALRSPDFESPRAPRLAFGPRALQHLRLVIAGRCDSDTLLRRVCYPRQRHAHVGRHASRSKK